MILPILLRQRSPEIRFEVLSKSEEDFRYSLGVRNEAMRPHLTQRWEWDEAWQERLHRSRFDIEPFTAIFYKGRKVGTLCLENLADHWSMSEFYIALSSQNQGIGSMVLHVLCAAADETGQTIRLQCLRWNPAVGLYRRSGFRQIGRTEINIIMERQPIGADRLIIGAPWEFLQQCTLRNERAM